MKIWLKWEGAIDDMPNIKGQRFVHFIEEDIRLSIQLSKFHR